MHAVQSIKDLFLKYQTPIFYLSFSLVLVMSLYAYTAKLNYEYFFTDEILYVTSGEEYLSGEFTLNIQHSLIAKYIAGVAALLFGHNVSLLRLPFALIGVMTGVVAFLIGRMLYNKWLGLLAMILLIGAPYFFVSTRMVMMESPMHLLWMVAHYFFIKYLISRKNKSLYLAGVFIGLSLGVKITSVTLIPFVLIMLWGFKSFPSPKVLIKFLFAICATFGLTYIHFLLITGAQGPILFARTVKDVFIGRNQEGKEHVINGVVYNKSPYWFYFYYLYAKYNIAALIISAAAIFNTLIKRNRWALYWLIFLVLNFALFQSLSLKNSRYLSTLEIPLVFLIVSFIAGINIRKIYKIAGAVVILILFISPTVEYITHLQPTKYRALEIYMKEATDNYNSTDRLFLFGSVRSSRWHFADAPEDSVIFRKDYEVMYREFPNFKYIALDKSELLKNPDNALYSYVQNNLDMYEKVEVDGFYFYKRL